ncbi:MAG: hypothetical protein ACXWCG_07500 [Flavitalea sp.]
MPAISILSIFFLTACSSSRITHSWRAENVLAKKYNKILVLGLYSETDISTRERMENHMTADLVELGYTAGSGLKEYGPKSFRKMDEATLLEKLQSSGFDAVLTIVLLDKSKERNYVPSHVNNSPYMIYHRRFWGYYTTIHDRIYTPGYYTINTRYFWESNFYDLTTKELIYSVQTESFDPASSESLGHEYGKMIVKDMVKNNVLIKPEIVSVK